MSKSTKPSEFPIFGYLDRDNVRQGMIIKGDACYIAFTSRGWQWGGNLTVHQLTQALDGTLSVCMPRSLMRSYPEAKLLDDVSLEVLSGHRCTPAVAIPQDCLISMDIKLTPGTAGAGVMLRCSEDRENCYALRLEPARSQVVLDSSARSCEHPDIDRPYTFEPGCIHHLDILLDDSMLVAYLDNRLALSARIYDLKGEYMALFCTDGIADFTNITVCAYCHPFET